MAKFVEGFAARLVVPENERDIQVFDDALPGFGIRKFASGRASYFVKFNVGRKQRRLTLGAVVTGNLADMRKQASKTLAKARLGQDAVAEKKAATGKRTASLGSVVLSYLSDREPKLRPRYYVEVKRHLERDWRPLHGEDLASITRHAVIDVIDTISGRQGEVAADRARVALSGLYGWAIERGYCDATPTANIGPRAHTGSRDRVLSVSELVEVWRCCGEDDYGRVVRLLLLTGQRRLEIGDLGWSEINDERHQIELPADRVKNGRPHIIPLSAGAHTIISAIERREDRDLVFGRGAGGFSGWSKAKNELDDRIARARKTLRINSPMPAWRLHDLRRSFVTHVNDNKIAPPHIVEAIVNHVSGHLAGVAGTYNKALYLDERRDALSQWDKFIQKAVAA
jgi:integrase